MTDILHRHKNFTLECIENWLKAEKSNQLINATPRVHKRRVMFSRLENWSSYCIIK